MRESSNPMPEPANANLLRVFRHYDALRGAAAMPHRSCFRPIDLHWLFGQFYAVEILRDGDYRFGYCGPLWALMYGVDRAGKRLSEMEAFDQAQNLRPLYDAAVASRRPHWHRCRLVWRGGQTFAHERVTIPFAGDNGDPALLLVVAQCGRDISEALRDKGYGVPRLEIDTEIDIDTLQSPIQSINSSRRSA